MITILVFFIVASPLARCIYIGRVWIVKITLDCIGSIQLHVNFLAISTNSSDISPES